MICEICGKTVKKDEAYRTKDRKRICYGCAAKYPQSVAHNIGNFTFAQIKTGVETICEKFRGSKPYVSRYQVGITDDAIIVNDFLYKFYHLESVKAVFHPREKVNNYLVKGDLTLRIVTKNPAIELNEFLYTGGMITVEYELRADCVKYFIDSPLEVALDKLNDMLDRQIYSSPDFLMRLAESGNWVCHGISKPEPARPLTDLDRAMIRFGLTMPYTEKDVDSAWKKLIRKEKLHPDEGGTNDAFIESEKARDLLKTKAEGGVR